MNMDKPALPLLSEQVPVVLDANSYYLCASEIAYINHAAQMHEELVEALRELRASHSATFPSSDEGQVAQTAWGERKERAESAADAILAKAEGR